MLNHDFFITHKSNFMPDINKLYTAEDAESKEYENVVYILIINSLKKQVQFINMKNQK